MLERWHERENSFIAVIIIGFNITKGKSASGYQYGWVYQESKSWTEYDNISAVCVCNNIEVAH